jgi:hypothetical protein
MDRAEQIEEALRRIQPILEAVFESGVKSAAETNEAMKKDILAALGLPTDLAVGRRPAKATGKRSSAKARAPKGAASATIEAAFAQRDGWTISEIAALKEGMNYKTIYNELGRKKDKYRQEDGKWFRIAPVEHAASQQPEAPTVGATAPTESVTPAAAPVEAAAEVPQNAPAPDPLQGSGAGFGADASASGGHSAEAPVAAGEVGGT